MLHAVGEIDELHTLLAALWRPVWEEEEERAVSCHMFMFVFSQIPSFVPICDACHDLLPCLFFSNSSPSSC